MSGSNCCFLICVQISQETDKVVWYSHLLKNFPQFVLIHTVKGFGVVNEREVDVFLEFSHFSYGPMDVGNLISGSSAFSKSSLYIWKFSVHILLKLSLKDFKHNLDSMWDECNCAVVWGHCLSLGLEWKLTFSSSVASWVFQICWRIECNTLTASTFRIWNSPAGIPLSLLTLFVVMLPKANFTSHSRISGWVNDHTVTVTQVIIFFCIVLLCILATSS